MAIKRVLSSDSGGQGEETFNLTLRPKSLGECIGQANIKEKLAIAITAANQHKPAGHRYRTGGGEWRRRLPYLSGGPGRL